MLWAIIKFQFEGVHKYPEASGAEEFLKYDHRHIFHVEVWIEQRHENRDVEYLNCKRWLQKEAVPHLTLPGTTSCETLARQIVFLVQQKYGDRRVICEVLEDGENGARCEN